jgi:hypothetical protein
MNGAIPEPDEKTNSTPNNIKIVMIGRSQNFFLSRRNPKRSLINSILFKYY